MTQNSQPLSLVVTFDDKECMRQANSIAKQLGCPVCDNSGLYDLVLMVQYIPASDFFGMELTLNKLQPPLKLFLDFNDARSQHRKQSGGGKRQHIVRATGLHKNQNLRILDATAGLGGDSFVLACNGATVTLAEQHPLLVLILENAIMRAQKTHALADIAKRMNILTSLDSLELLQSNDLQKKYDVIYLDPMYPSSQKKQAKAKKSMQIIQYLSHDFSNQDDQLLEAALDTGIKRIVVKRPAGASPLMMRAPQSTIESTNTRYDIYI